MNSQTNPTDRRRLDYIDALRGFAIVTVVLGHALQYTLTAPDENPLFRLIYSFHMPLFMFISGFVYSGARRGIADELQQKALSLLLPFLAWLPVTFIWTQYSPDAPTAWAFVQRVIASPDAGGLWFLWVLFLINLLIVLSRTIMPARPLVLACTLWLLLNLLAVRFPHSNALGLKLLCWHFPFFMAGLLLRRHQASKFLTLPVAASCSVLFLLLFQHWSRTGASALLASAHGLQSLLLLRAFNYLIAFLAITLVFSVFASAAMAHSGKAFCKLGRISLEIYAAHIYFVALAVSLTTDWAAPAALRISLVFACGLVGALCLSGLIKRVRVLALVMFGLRVGAARPGAAGS